MAKRAIAKAYVQIVPTTDGIKGSLSSALSGESEKAGKSAGSSIVSGIKKVIVAAGIGKIISSAMSEGGALQQSYLGGLDTLYGEAADAARKYADEAAKAGISANSYAEQAVSFGAALKSAYGGDTLKAAEAANTAIMDMADNSAKMGTDLSSIQNAYQGFAKQNYTMLDNLKLGYGGTKSEMERLLADAQALSGVEYNIDNLGDVYEALHVTQSNLGLTGVAADEASGTFTGSMAAMKAAAQNLLGKIALGEEIDYELDILLGNAKAFLVNNAIPMLFDVVRGLIGVLPTLATEVTSAVIDIIPDITESILATVRLMGTQLLELINVDMIVGLINTITEAIPNIISTGMDVTLALTEGILQAIPDLVAVLPELVLNLVDTLLSNVPLIINTGIQLLTSLVQNLPAIIEGLVVAIPTIVNGVIDSLINNVPLIVEAGVNLFTALIMNLPAIIAGIIKAIPQIIISIVNGFKDSWPQMKEAGLNLIKGVGEGIANAAGWLIGKVKELCKNALSAIKNFFGIKSPSRVMADQVGKFIPAGIAKGVSDNLGIVDKAMDDLKSHAVGKISTGLDANISATYAGSGSGIASNGDNNVTINVYGSQGQNVNDLANIVMEKIQMSINRKGAIYA